MTTKLALLITGGTIGMENSATGESKLPTQQLDYAKLAEFLPSEIQVTQHRICYKDSSFIQPADWCALISCISKHQADYAGFIISHGTDTMAYSAAALSYHCGTPLARPLVFTGSCRTPDRPDTDAWQNLAAAARVAASDLAETAIVFAGKIWRACRALKVASPNDSIYITPGVAALGEIDAQHLSFASHAIRRSANQPSQPPAAAPQFSNALLYLSALPALSQPALLDLAANPHWQLALIQGLGNGNLSAEIISFIAAGRKHHKYFVILPPAPGGTIYPPLRQALDLGAVLAAAYTQPALWVKLSRLLPELSKLQQQQGYQAAANFLATALQQPKAGDLVQPAVA